MKIIIKTKEFKGDDYWQSKLEGVILVEKQSDINILWELLCNQDDCWENYKHIIKVAPKEIDSISDLYSMCEYVGKTDIDNPKDLKKSIPFIIFQHMSEV